MFRNIWESSKLKVNEVINYPLPMGKTILVVAGLIVLTAVVSSRNKTIIMNHYHTGGGGF